MRRARHDFDPGMRDADQRLGEVLIGEPDRLEHGARGRPRGSIDQHTGIGAQFIVSHLEKLSTYYLMPSLTRVAKTNRIRREVASAEETTHYRRYVDKRIK